MIVPVFLPYRTFLQSKKAPHGCAQARIGKMLLTQPRLAREFRLRNSLLQIILYFVWESDIIFHTMISREYLYYD